MLTFVVVLSFLQRFQMSSYYKEYNNRYVCGGGSVYLLLYFL